jgi:hypothetical protein
MEEAAMRRRQLIVRAIWSRALLILLVALPASATPFVFVSLPDTQVYSENRFPDLTRTPAVTDPRGTGAIFFDQTQWIVDNAEPLGIRYVGHLGDIVQNGSNLIEWELAKEAMNLLLAADIPHGTVMGNHDDTHPPDYARNYLMYFGPHVFAGLDWYAAASPGGGANLQILEHDRYKIGFLNFSIDHPRSEIEWANNIVGANPDTIFVIGTHRYLYDLKIGAGRYGEDISTILGDFNVMDNFVDGVIDPTSAEDLFNQFVSQYPNILMIHAGHFHAEWLRLDGLNPEQKLIIQILTDYQSTRNGGDGWLRLYQLDFEAGEFRFDTYSPTLDRWRTTIDHFVETVHLAWEQRGQLIDVIGITEAQYLALLEIGFKRDPDIPDDFLLQHPDFDEPEERAYYQQYLNDLFLGNPPPGFDNILDWERLWMIAFAPNSDDPFDFSDAARSPQGRLEIDFFDYFTPSPSQLSGWTFDDLFEALEAFSPEDYRSHSAGRRLLRSLEIAARLAGHERYDIAAVILERLVLPTIDGCAERGRPDVAGPWRRFWQSWQRPDLLDNCPAQAVLHPLVMDAAELLGTL